MEIIRIKSKNAGRLGLAVKTMVLCRQPDDGGCMSNFLHGPVKQERRDKLECCRMIVGWGFVSI